jgi:PAS domain S-box-containing protein
MESAKLDWMAIATLVAGHCGKPVVALDHRGEVQLMNAQMAEVLGWSRPEVDKKAWVDLCVPPESAARTRTWLSLAQAGASCDCRCEVVTRTGRRLVLDLRASPVGQGPKAGLVLTALPPLGLTINY